MMAVEQLGDISTVRIKLGTISASNNEKNYVPTPYQALNIQFAHMRAEYHHNTIMFETRPLTVTYEGQYAHLNQVL